MRDDTEQVMDEGWLTDSHGKRVDFRNSLLILTSNLGADALAALPDGAAANEAEPQVPRHVSPSRACHPCPRVTIEPQVLRAIGEALPPEFVNRLDRRVSPSPLPPL